MDRPRFWQATTAGFVTSFVVGFLLWGIVLADFMAANTFAPAGVIKDPPILWIMAAGELALALLMTLMISWKGDPGAAQGAKVGAIFWFLLGIGLWASFLGMMNLYTPGWAVVDLAAGILRGAVVGAVIGLVLGRGEGASA
jgi:hypothetical protein